MWEEEGVGCCVAVWCCVAGVAGFVAWFVAGFVASVAPSNCVWEEQGPRGAALCGGGGGGSTPLFYAERARVQAGETRRLLLLSKKK